MTKTIAKLMVLAFGATLFTAGSALASDKCKDVKINFKNSSKDVIKITKFEYYDYDKAKWRSESLGSSKVNPGKTWTWKRSLEYVKNDKTKFKATYKEQIGGSKWSSSKTNSTGSFTCSSSMSKTLTFK